MLKMVSQVVATCSVCGAQGCLCKFRLRKLKRGRCQGAGRQLFKLLGELDRTFRLVQKSNSECHSVFVLVAVLAGYYPAFCCLHRNTCIPPCVLHASGRKRAPISGIILLDWRLAPWGCRAPRWRCAGVAAGLLPLSYHLSVLSSA